MAIGFALGAGTLFTIILLIVGVGIFFSSIVPLNLERYKEWTADQLYYTLYPKIKEDFMGRDDCQAVHTDGNMLAGESTVTHVTFSGGDDTLASVKERTYQTRLEQGEITLQQAQETGEFTA